MSAHPRPGPRLEQGGQPARLESWKEIAGYLNRTVRTVQRWEQDEGLPIHRHGHEQRDSVHALTSELDDWLIRRRPPKRKNGSRTPATFRMATRWAIPGGAAILLALAAAGWHYWAGSHPVLPFADRDWVVLADFENQTGEPLLDEGLRMAFAVSLQQSRHANLLPESRLRAVLRRMEKPEDTRIDESIGREICAREGPKVLILPGISKVGGVYALSARLVEVKTGEPVAAYQERARSQDQILDALGRMAAQVRRGLGESLASIRRNDEPLPQVTTRSLEGLRNYAEGALAWDRGQYDHGLELYNAAVQHDPDFAMAHAALGDALLSHVYNRFEEGKMHFELARQLGGRVTERERLAIEARYHAALRHVEKAAEAYQAYLASYPDDFDARSGFAYFLMRNDRSEEAIGQYREVIRVSPGNSAALINLASTYQNLNRPADAIPCYQKAFALEPRWLTIANINHEYGFTLATAGNMAKAREVFGLAVATPGIKPGGLRSLALLAMYEGKYRNAANLLMQAIAGITKKEDILALARDRLFLAMLHYGRGDRRGALAELDRTAATLEGVTQPVIWARARVGVMYARAGAVGKAMRLLTDLAPKADRQSSQDASELHLLEGEIALAKGEYPHAISVLAMAHGEAKWSLTLAALARGYDRAGNIDQAAASYEELISKSDAAGWEPQQDLLEASVRLAKIYLDRGDKSHAASTLDPLAKLWAEADPDLPLARRIAELQAALR